MIAAALLLLGAESAPSQPSPPLRPGNHIFTLEHDGRARRYRLHVPRRGRSPTPLMFGLHGGGGHGAQFQRDNGLDPVADREGFITVYPDGTGKFEHRFLSWNAGPTCCGWAGDHDVDDVGFLAAVLGDVQKRVAIDAKRVYMTGHSNGAMMAYRFAAERSALIAAIIPVAGAMAVTEFRPSTPVAVLHIHSRDDPRALYAGGLGPPFPGTDRRVEHASVVDGVTKWANANGCSATPRQIDAIAGTGTNHGQRAVRLSYDGCRPGGTVQHIKLFGVGHGWPGGKESVVMRQFIGRGTTIIDAAEEVFSFVRTPQ